VTNRAILEPSPEHPIDVRPTEGHVTVHINGQQVAATNKALTLSESTYPAVQYIPIHDVDESLLQHSTTTTYCPYKGDASYFSVVTDKGTVEDVIWTYNEPFPAVAAIRQHVAFYIDRADVAVGPR
jgi:uncharacterized protein (DUF427 family)